MLLRSSRASAGAVLEGIRKGRARRGMLPLGVSFWDGAFLVLQPGGRGACLSFRPGGVFGSLSAERGGVVVCGVLPQGGIVRASSSSLCLGGRTPPGAAQTPRHLQRHCKRASAGGSADCIRA